jgi:hypothetical protein
MKPVSYLPETYGGPLSFPSGLQVIVPMTQDRDIN